MSDTIICPKCKFEIEVTEVLSSQLREQLRNADLRQTVTNTSGLYGDLAGIVGGTFPKIETLELPALEVDDSPSDAEL